MEGGLHVPGRVQAGLQVHHAEHGLTRPGRDILNVSEPPDQAQERGVGAHGLAQTLEGRCHIARGHCEDRGTDPFSRPLRQPRHRHDGRMAGRYVLVSDNADPGAFDLCPSPIALVDEQNIDAIRNEVGR